MQVSTSQQVSEIELVMSGEPVHFVKIDLRNSI